jgi:hypothetical protein
MVFTVFETMCSMLVLGYLQSEGLDTVYLSSLFFIRNNGEGEIRGTKRCLSSGIRCVRFMLYTVQ